MSALRSLAGACALLILLPAAGAIAAEPGKVAALAAEPGKVAPGPGKVSFYFAAHEDDWQLFMNPNAFNDVTGGSRKTVFIHVTAGDAGLGAGSGGRKHPFYLARENGALQAIRFMVDADKTPIKDSEGPVSFDGHSIYRVRYGNAVSYFLRLPDGGSGTGFEGTGFQSLKRFANGDIGAMSAVDGSTSYQGWKDLVTTVQHIVSFERGRSPLAQINIADLDPSINRPRSCRSPRDRHAGARRGQRHELRESRLLCRLCQRQIAPEPERARPRFEECGIRGDARRRHRF